MPTVKYLEGSPRRRCVLDIQIQADTPERIIGMLQWLLMDVEQHGLRESLSGGFDASHSMSYDEDANITHETFGEALESYMRKRIKSVV
jgi:hypothetical protein